MYNPSPALRKGIATSPLCFHFHRVVLLKILQSVTTTSECFFICVFVAVAARTHHRAHAPTLARRLTYTQTQARTHCPIVTHSSLALYLLAHFDFCYFYAPWHMANTNIHYYAGFLMLFFVIVVLAVVVVALVVNVCPLTSKHALRTLLLSMSWHALRCVALRTKAANRLKATNGICSCQQQQRHRLCFWRLRRLRSSIKTNLTLMWCTVLHIW